MAYSFTDEQKQLLSEWANELENGNRAQGMLYLKKQNDGEDFPKYCCLGVYLDFSFPNHWVDFYFFGHGFRSYRFVREGENWTASLPTEIAEKLGLTQQDSEFPMSLQEIFIQMNDKLGLSFQEISSEIRHLIEVDSFSEKFIITLKSSLTFSL